MEYLETLISNTDLFKAVEIFTSKKRQYLASSKVKEVTNSTKLWAIQLIQLSIYLFVVTCVNLSNQFNILYTL